ncbi:hypothetical protein EMCRGX_G009450 [Ephydatia muelleri]
MKRYDTEHPMDTKLVVNKIVHMQKEREEGHKTCFARKNKQNGDSQIETPQWSYRSCRCGFLLGGGDHENGAALFKKH